MVDIGLLFKRYLKNIWMLIIIPLVSAVCAYVLLEYTPKTYVSTAKVSTGFTTNNKINLTNEQFRASDAWYKFDNLIAMMQSELLLSMLSYDLLLHDLNTKIPFRTLDEDNTDTKIVETSSLIDSTIQIILDKQTRFEMLNSYDNNEKALIDLLENYDYISWMLGKNLSVDREKSSDYVAINFISENPHLSAFVVNSIAKQYIRYDSLQAVNYSSRSVEFFSNLVISKKLILDQKSKTVDNYKSNNKLFGSGETNQGFAQLLTLEEKRLETESDVRRLEMSLNNIENRIVETKSLNNKEKNVSTATIIQLKERINSLNQQIINDGSNDSELILKIAELRRLLRTELEKYPVLSDDLKGGNIKSLDELIEEKNQMKLELRIANSDLVTIENNLAQIRNGLSSSEMKSANLATLDLEKETASKEYLQAVEKYNIEKNKAMASFSNIQIIQEGRPNDYPESYNKRKIVVILAFMVSLSICVFIITAIEFFDKRIRTTENFKRILKQNVLGRIDKENGTRIDLKEILEANSSTNHSNVELLRKIRYNIELTGFKTILFTSTNLNQGKSFLILSLAKSISLLNKRILIIDTNFKNNAITKALLNSGGQKMIEEHSSKFNIILKEDDSFDIKKNFVSETINKNIDIIGNRLNNASPSEIFAGRNFQDIIESMKSYYDYIFLEGPALNNYSDTKELIQFTEGVICVFSVDSSIQNRDHDSLEFLKQCNHKFIGSILNQTESTLES